MRWAFIGYILAIVAGKLICTEHHHYSLQSPRPWTNKVEAVTIKAAKIGGTAKSICDFVKSFVGAQTLSRGPSSGNQKHWRHNGKALFLSTEQASAISMWGEIDVLKPISTLRAATVTVDASSSVQNMVYINTGWHANFCRNRIAVWFIQVLS